MLAGVQWANHPDKNLGEEIKKVDIIDQKLKLANESFEDVRLKTRPTNVQNIRPLYT